MSLFLGIDFGSAKNFIAKWDENKSRAIPVLLGNYGGKGDFPNVIYYEPSENKIVGESAIKRGAQNSDNAVFAIKRHLKKNLEHLQKKFPAYNLEIQPSIKQKKEVFKIRQPAIETKKILSAEAQSDLIFSSTLSGNFILNEILTRADFEKLLADFLIGIKNILDDAIWDANLKRRNIPAIREQVQKYFERQTIEIVGEQIKSPPKKTATKTNSTLIKIVTENFQDFKEKYFAQLANELIDLKNGLNACSINTNNLVNVKFHNLNKDLPNIPTKKILKTPCKSSKRKTADNQRKYRNSSKFGAQNERLADSFKIRELQKKI